MPSLILGGSGQLGTAISQLRPGAAIPTRRELDLADTGRIHKNVVGYRPSEIINCAGYTDVDGADDHADEANTINGHAVGELARTAHDLGIPFVTFSSDYVFDGRGESNYTESSEPSPINEYGKSKLAGERIALEFPGSLVIRTSWLISATHPNFVSTIVGHATRGPVRVVDDQWGRPTIVDDLASASIGAIGLGLTGVLHLSGRPTATWYELARLAVGAAGLKADLVVPCGTEDYPTAAERPVRSVLSSERVSASGALSMPDWPARLADVVPAILENVTGSGI